MRKFPIAIVVALTVALWNAAGYTQAKAGADDVPSLLAKTNEAYAAGDYPALTSALERLHRLRPYNSEYMYRLVLAHALADNKQRAYDMMLRMQQQGLAYDFTQSEDSVNIRGTQVFDYVNDLMKLAAEPSGESEPVFVLPQDVSLPSSLAWDESRQKFLVGTVAEGQVLAVDEGGGVSELIRADNENGMWAVLDILVDAQRDRLWITSAAIPAFSDFSVPDKGRSALFEFDLASLQLLHKYPVPVDGRPHALGSMVMDPGGGIFVADRAMPVIYAKKPDGQKIEALLASREMVSQRGVAMQPDGRIMYVADRELGIMVVDLASQRAGKLAVPETLNVGGIDDLFLWNNHLIMIQNGISPERVVRLALDASGTRVEAVRPLAAALPEFDAPNFGALRGDELFYFANGRWRAGGDSTATGVTVMRVHVDSSADLVPPEMQLFMQQQQQAERQTEKVEKQ